MKITNTRIALFDNQTNLKAVASITLDECFVVHNLKVIQTENGLFVAMPSKKSANGEFKDIAHPLNTETRNYISSTVLQAYQATLAEKTQSDT